MYSNGTLTSGLYCCNGENCNNIVSGYNSTKAESASISVLMNNKNSFFDFVLRIMLLLTVQYNFS